MKPKKKTQEPQSDMFKPRLEDIVNPVHPLVRLTTVSAGVGAALDAATQQR